MGLPQPFKAYPKAKYHADVPGGKYVQNPDEEAALGPDWVDHPNDVKRPQPKEEVIAPVVSEAPSEPVVVEEDIETPDPIAGEPFGEPIKRGRGRPPKVRD